MPAKPIVIVAAADRVVRLLVASALRGGGFRVAENHGPRPTEEDLADLRPDVIVFEAEEPPLRAFDSVRLAASSGIPILLMSPLATPTRVAEGLDAGAATTSLAHSIRLSSERESGPSSGGAEVDSEPAGPTSARSSWTLTREPSHAANGRSASLAKSGRYWRPCSSRRGASSFGRSYSPRHSARRSGTIWRSSGCRSVVCVASLVFSLGMKGLFGRSTESDTYTTRMTSSRGPGRGDAVPRARSGPGQGRSAHLAASASNSGGPQRSEPPWLPPVLRLLWLLLPDPEPPRDWLWLPDPELPPDWLWDPPEPELEPLNWPRESRSCSRALASPPFWAIRRCSSSSMPAKPRWSEPPRPPP